MVAVAGALLLEDVTIIKWQMDTRQWWGFMRYMKKCMSETPVFQTHVNSNIQSNLEALLVIIYHLRTWTFL